MLACVDQIFLQSWAQSELSSKTWEEYVEKVLTVINISEFATVRPKEECELKGTPFRAMP